MAYCARCGHDLAAAPTCDRCGTPAVRVASPGVAATLPPRPEPAAVADTAERPTVVATAPEVAAVPRPPSEPSPSNARFPMYADEVAEDRVDEPGPAVASVAPTHVATRNRSMSDLLPWILLGFAAIGILLVTAIWLLIRPGGDAGAGSERPPASSAAAGDDVSADAQPSGGGSSEAAPTGPARDVAAAATAQVPATAPPNQDVSGRPVRYDAAQMFDGDSTTAWRMPGDGTGALITIRLAEPTEVRRVGLVNGYAKEAVDSQGRTIRWYLRNRRITRVSWSFDDGSVVNQDLRQRPRMQTIKVGAEVTSTISLRLLDVTAPLPGRLGRNFTAISEIRVKGTPQG